MPADVENNRLQPWKSRAPCDVLTQRADTERVDPAEEQDRNQQQRFGMPVKLHGGIVKDET